jgi:hypothetical protein
VRLPLKGTKRNLKHWLAWRKGRNVAPSRAVKALIIDAFEIAAQLELVAIIFMIVVIPIIQRSAWHFWHTQRPSMLAPFFPRQVMRSPTAPAPR